MLRVTAALLVRGNTVLICRRRWDKQHPGKWELPGGKVEPGETLAQCVRRELWEELGIDAEPGRELGHVQYHYPDGPECDIAFIQIARFAGTPTNHCFADMRWVQLGELSAYDFLEADREFIGRLDDGSIPVTPE